MDVNNTLTQMSLVEASADINISEVVEEHNPDCYVMVYAVDDEESFDKNENKMLTIVINLLNCRFSELLPLVDVLKQLSIRQVLHLGW